MMSAGPGALLGDTCLCAGIGKLKRDGSIDCKGVWFRLHEPLN